MKKMTKISIKFRHFTTLSAASKWVFLLLLLNWSSSPFCDRRADRDTRACEMKCVNHSVPLCPSWGVIKHHRETLSLYSCHSTFNAFVDVWNNKLNINSSITLRVFNSRSHIIHRLLIVLRLSLLWLAVNLFTFVDNIELDDYLEHESN